MLIENSRIAVSFRRWRSDLQAVWGFQLPSWSQIPAWTFGFVFLTALTTRDFLILFGEYRNNNVATQVEVVAFDENFKPPQHVILIPVYKSENRAYENLMFILSHLQNGTEDECQLCQQLEAVFWDVWNDGTMNRSQLNYEGLSAAFVRKLFAAMDIDDTNVFDEVFSPWNDVIFSSAVNFLLWLGEADYGLRPSRRLSSSFYTAVFPQNKTKLDLLFSRVLSGFCREIRVQSTISFGDVELIYEHKSTNTTCEDLFRSASVPVALDAEGLWIPLPSIQKPAKQFFTFTLMSGSVWKDNFWAPHPNGEKKYLDFRVFPDTGVAYATALDKLFSKNLYRGAIDNERRGMNVTLRYSVQLRVKETRLSGGQSCYNGTSATGCFTLCTKQYIIEKCGCVPFTSKQGLDYPEGMAYCSSLDYASCNITGFPNEKRDYCKEKCKVACEYTSYTWKTIDNKYQPDRPNVSELALRFLPAFGTFAQLSWTDKTTTEQFLSQIGGIVKLYLGFSGLSLIAMMFVFVDFVKRLRRKRKNTSNGDGVSLVMATDVLTQSELSKLLSQMKEEVKNELLQVIRAEIRSEVEKVVEK